MGPGGFYVARVHVMFYPTGQCQRRFMASGKISIRGAWEQLSYSYWLPYCKSLRATWCDCYQLPCFTILYFSLFFFNALIKPFNNIDSFLVSRVFHPLSYAGRDQPPILATCSPDTPVAVYLFTLPPLSDRLGHYQDVPRPKLNR